MDLNVSSVVTFSSVDIVKLIEAHLKSKGYTLDSIVSDKFSDVTVKVVETSTVGNDPYKLP